MREYTKHNIKRIRDLNEKYFEVVIGKESLNFLPGSAVRLYNDGDEPLFIASGIQEPWVRLIMNRDLFPNFDFEQRNLKLSSEVQTLIGDLNNETSPNFVIDADGASGRTRSPLPPPRRRRRPEKRPHLPPNRPRSPRRRPRPRRADVQSRRASHRGPAPADAGCPQRQPLALFPSVNDK